LNPYSRGSWPTRLSAIQQCGDTGRILLGQKQKTAGKNVLYKFLVESEMHYKKF
jgi:hypothetical protein